MRASRVTRSRSLRIEPVGLDQREGDLAVEAGVVGAVDDLPAAFAEQTQHLVAAAGERGGQRRRLGRRRLGQRVHVPAAVPTARAAAAR